MYSSRALRTPARARCRRTRWLPSLSSSSSQTSSESNPSTSRRTTTARWRSGSAAIARRRYSRASSEASRRCGSSQARGGADQWLGQVPSPPWKRARSTAGVAASSSARQRGEGHRAPLAGRPPARLVLDDPEQPALQRGALCEGVEPLQRPQPGLLDDLLGDRVTGAEAAGEALQRAVVSLHQLGEGALVPSPERDQEPGIVELGTGQLRRLLSGEEASLCAAVGADTGPG